MSKVVLYGQQKWPIVSTISYSYKAKDKQYPYKLKGIAASAGLLSLSSVMTNTIFYTMFVRVKFPIENQWSNYLVRERDYLAYYNPKVMNKSELLVSSWEQCGAYPNLKVLMRRPAQVEIAYFDQAHDLVQKTLFGFQARVFQHEVDHLADLDLLKQGEDICISKSIKEEKKQQIYRLFKQYREQKSEIKQKTYVQSECFNKLRQQLVYNVIGK